MTISVARSPWLAVVAALAAAASAACSSGHEPAVCAFPVAAAASAPAPVPRKATTGSFPVVARGRTSTPRLDPGVVPEALGCELTPAIPADQPFTVSGTATYDFVPAVYTPATGGGGLDFAHAVQRPVREAVVEVRQCGNLLATTATDVGGHYAATFTPGPTGEVAVYVLARVPSPALEVRDNWSGATWAVAQPIASTSPTLDVHATHGWTGSHYGASRIAAPFAILDSVYVASRRLLDLPRAVAFDAVPLIVNWSPLNTPDSIGTSFYDSSIRQIFLLGADGIDTDEFDREVIVHEWGHYFEDNFSRSDTPGGDHGFGDVLDPRLAFGEGYASAFAAMLLQQTIYADTYWGYGGLDAFGWDVETAPAPSSFSYPNPADDPDPGPFSELSVIRAMWDLYDSGTNEATYDNVALGLGPIYDTLVGPERTTHALTTLASFVTGLKTQPGVDASAVNALLAHYGIGPIASEWGDGDARLRAMYADVPSPSPSPFQLTANLSGSFRWNEQPQNQYYVFTATGSRATVTAASSSDVDLYGAHSGRALAAAESGSGCERIGFDTVPGEVYVVVLTGWGGVSSGVFNLGTYSAAVTFSSP